MTETSRVAIASLTVPEFEARLPDLAALLRDCVHAGASVNFVAPFELPEAEAFWRTKVAPPLAAGARLLWIAEQDGRLLGTVQLDLDTPPNQPHRAEATKLLVHPGARRQGVGRALMTRLEAAARARGRRLITLDTRTGDAAEPLYAGLGYVAVGVIPGFCRDPIADRLDATTIMYKQL